MGIYKGGTPLSDLKLGSTTIQNVYKGTNLIWKSEPPMVSLELQAPSEYFSPDQNIRVHGDFYVNLVSSYDVEVYDNYSLNTYIYYWNPTGDEAEVVGAIIYREDNDGNPCSASLAVGTPLHIVTSLTVAIDASYRYIEHLIDVKGGINPGANEQYFNPSSLVTHRELEVTLLQSGDIDVYDCESGVQYTFARNGSSGATVDSVVMQFEDYSGYPVTTQLAVLSPLHFWSRNTVKFTAYTTYTPPLISIAVNQSTGDNVEWDEQNGLLYFNFSHLGVYNTSTWTPEYYSGTICIEDTNYNIPSLYQLGQMAGERFTPGVMTARLTDMLGTVGDKYYCFPGVANTPFVSCGNAQGDANVILNWYNNPGIYDKWDDEAVATRGLNSTDMKILAAMFQIPNQWQFADGTTFSQGAMGIFSNFNCSFLRSINYNNGQANCQWEGYLFGGFIPSDFNYLQYPEMLVFEQDLARAMTQSVQFDSYNMPNSGHFYRGKIRLKDLAHTSYSQDS